ncbi:sel1 repeat family protein [Francisellaceae bacterium]|nr:sel1 repeat family protein [Francisellaceae bacterium]
MQKHITPLLNIFIAILFTLQVANALPTQKNIDAHTILTVKILNETHQQASSGNALAEANLGTAYMSGSIGSIPNYTQAIYWLKKAAKQNSGLAYYGLYLIYNRGLSVPRDEAKALEYAKKSIPLMISYIKQHPKQTNALHNWRLGQAYFWGISGEKTIKGKATSTLIVQRNLQTSFNYFHHAAEDGDFHSMLSIIYMYQHGLGTKENPKEAFLWAKYLSTLHFPLAYYITAIDYLHGTGVKQSRKEAIKLLNKDVQDNYYPALQVLTTIAKSGDKTALDMIKSDTWEAQAYTKLQSQLAMDPYFTSTQ